MHVHDCRYCDREFVCRDTLGCFNRGVITCRDCYWTRELRPLIISALIAITLTSVLIYFFEK
jgi:hypothetical protein